MYFQISTICNVAGEYSFFAWFGNRYFPKKHMSFMTRLRGNQISSLRGQEPTKIAYICLFCLKSSSEKG